MTDGAHLGYGAEASMKAALGADEPKRGLTVMEMRAYLQGAPDVPESYDDGARTAGKLALGFLERHPEASDMAADSQHDWPDGYNKPAVVIREGLYDYMKRSEADWFQANYATVWSQMTGFMWGWAVNAARRCLELPPVPNPAIVEIA